MHKLKTALYTWVYKQCASCYTPCASVGNYPGNAQNVSRLVDKLFTWHFQLGHNLCYVCKLLDFTCTLDINKYETSMYTWYFPNLFTLLYLYTINFNQVNDTRKFHLKRKHMMMIMILMIMITWCCYSVNGTCTKSLICLNSWVICQDRGIVSEAFCIINTVKPQGDLIANNIMSISFPLWTDCPYWSRIRGHTRSDTSHNAILPCH